MNPVGKTKWRLFTRETAVWAAILGAYVVFSAWYWSSAHPVDTINAFVLAAFWLVVLCGAIRAIHLPIQYLTHRAALRRWTQEEASLDRERERWGFAVVRYGRRDPTETPWYRW
jgi:hypothetical protein